MSVGHQQMTTDPIDPLGLSIWQLTTPRPMAEAGGRPTGAGAAPTETDPAMVDEVIAETQASPTEAKRTSRTSAVRNCSNSS
ncbi:hypothetical protein [Kibdelosporangium phytohabitans]|uniref:Uncharacterized protein n=1 Tax=Kibdelosporangium phytohabitans TaxID=860235 RepID=A0A0N9IDI9_9PSEU|nr:hypothetical protein [Kibdelosporangium phytohabitans]ALG13368.1 hypothetical protein AOZ06_46720 [Kibdelosporangium phytohabitans]MBE1465156.1 hypothetical protein [Kibdelosporangium phytohabitans]